LNRVVDCPDTLDMQVPSEVEFPRIKVLKGLEVPTEKGTKVDESG